MTRSGHPRREDLLLLVSLGLLAWASWEVIFWHFVLAEGSMALAGGTVGNWVVLQHQLPPAAQWTSSRVRLVAALVGLVIIFLLMVALALGLAAAQFALGVPDIWIWSPPPGSRALTDIIVTPLAFLFGCALPASAAYMATRIYERWGRVEHHVSR